jgi:hypothetical protein
VGKWETPLKFRPNATILALSGRYFSDNNDLIAERKGFEPLAPLSSAAAYQAALSHSATSGQVLA